MRRLVRWYKHSHINALIIFFFLIYIVLLMKFVSIRQLSDNILYGIYGLVLTFYICIRFTISYFYDPRVKEEADNYQPTITFGIPAKNEEEHIKKTILDIARIDYPKKKFSIIAVDDGSTDSTHEMMKEAKKEAAKLGVNVQVVHWRKNKGKRAGMAKAIRLGKGEIIIFIDSDSFLEKSAAKNLVKYFYDKTVGAVAGHAYVANATKNILTRMQATRYYVAFKSYKGAESLFGSVSCCSGCCSAYRREYLLSILSEWEKQRFLGIPCTYGDDRSLTNALLKNGYQTLYAPDAISYTLVPETFKVFMRQQLRWKKSWFRETLLGCKFMWKRHPLISVMYYLGFFLPLCAPFFVFRAIIWLPLVHRQYPIQYFFGLILMSVIYAFYYYLCTKDKEWKRGILFSALYTVLLIWQLPYAILTIRDSRWGTR